MGVSEFLFPRTKPARRLHIEPGLRVLARSRQKRPRHDSRPLVAAPEPRPAARRKAPRHWLDVVGGGGAAFGRNVKQAAPSSSTKATTWFQRGSSRNHTKANNTKTASVITSWTILSS